MGFCGCGLVWSGGVGVGVKADARRRSEEGERGSAA